ncbi:MAG: ribonuclease Z [Candidatus Pacearchaeota archaeon]|nr:MAG: ribonuclease Z [Candidatus Pacearchaeota archaeon]
MPEKIKILFLGTSDSIPTATRNHPSFLISYKGENILVDCGEGTQRQLRKANLNPCKITKILISHWHADHVLGIPGLLKTLAMSNYNKKLFIYCPKKTKKALEILLKLFGFRNEISLEIKEVEGKFFENEDFFIEANQLFHTVPCNAYSFVKKKKIKIDKEKLKKYKIPEGPHLKKLKEGKDLLYDGKKYKLEKLTYIEDEKKVSFIMDTSFNKKIINYVKNSDVLICESTFSSDFRNKAKEYKHLTSIEAAEIAKKSKSKKLFLVHISQRFSKNPEKILRESKRIFKNTFLPKDFDLIEI